MATGTQSTVVAVFANRSDADNAVRDLKANGFANDDIDIGSYSDYNTTGASREWKSTSQHEGGIKGWFESLFGHHHEHSADATDYENAADQGGVVVSVDVDNQNVELAAEILDKYKPVEIRDEASASQTQAPAAGTTQARTASSTSGKGSTTSTDPPKSIPVVKEDLKIGKRGILRGGVRVYSRVVEQPVEQTVRLREEHVRVDRQPVNRDVQPGDVTAGRDQVIEVQEFAEEPVVQKQARVVEEVRVNKEASERTETIRDNVRNTEVNVENLNEGKGGFQTFDEDFRRDFQTRYSSSGGRYEDYAPAYEYGYQAANDPRYQGRNWDEVESDLRTDYGRRYPNSAWDRMKESIRYGWDKVTGRARGASGSR